MKKVSILIVDDDELDRYLLSRDLRSGNIDAKVFECSDGTDALEFLTDYEDNRRKFGDDFPPLVIFLDINMPRLSGFDFLERFAGLRSKHEDYASCVIMMFSSSEHPSERERAFAYDYVTDFVIKGQTNPEDLREKVLKAVA